MSADIDYADYAERLETLTQDEKIVLNDRLRYLYANGDRSFSEDRELLGLMSLMGLSRMGMEGQDSWDVYAGYVEECETYGAEVGISYEEWCDTPAPWDPNWSNDED